MGNKYESDDFKKYGAVVTLRFRPFEARDDEEAERIARELARGGALSQPAQEITNVKLTRLSE